MDMRNIPVSSTKVGPITKLLAAITGTDGDILKLCPPHDSGVVRGLGTLMILNTLFESSIYTYIAHRLTSSSGQIRFELVVAGLSWGSMYWRSTPS